MRVLLSSRSWVVAATLLLLVSSVRGASDNAKHKSPSTTPATPVALLEEAEQISRTFIPDDRADLLLEVAKSAVPLDKAKAQTWALQLFAYSRTALEPGHYRQAMEKNALQVLARVDPVRSADLFRQQDLPDVKEFPNEDVRAFAAITLFPELWEKKGKAALPKIEELADWLGSTGQYPYTAIGPVILELAKSDSKTSTSLFGSAITYLPRDPGYLVTNLNFTSLILKVKPVVPSALLREAVTEDVAAIKRSEESKKGRARFEVTSRSGMHSFDSEGQVLIYRLLPVVEQMDPDWAAKLKTDFGLTGVATPGANEPLTMAAAVTPPGQEESASDTELQGALDAHRLMQSQQLSETDPKAAAQLAMQISDPVLRSVALVTAAPTYATSDASQAGAWVSGARQQLNSLPPSLGKLQLMIALIKVSIANGHREEAQQQIGKAYDFGEELFEGDLRANPGKFSPQGEGFDELVDLTSVAARQPWLTTDSLNRIRELRNDVLRARLLVEQAKAMAAARQANSGTS
jgi:hypothetical protein